MDREAERGSKQQSNKLAFIFLLFNFFYEVWTALRYFYLLNTGNAWQDLILTSEQFYKNIKHRQKASGRLVDPR